MKFKLNRMQKHRLTQLQLFCLLLLLVLISLILLPIMKKRGIDNLVYANPVGVCNALDHHISQPLNDLGSNEYFRPTSSTSSYATGYFGGLYANGSNTRPAAHNAAGEAIANQIFPLNESGQIDTVNGKIVMISIGMSNTFQEFTTFVEQAEGDSSLNPQLIIKNTAQGGQDSEKWVPLPGGSEQTAWDKANGVLMNQTPTVSIEQVQIAWVKLARRHDSDNEDFPDQAQSLQNDLEIISRNLKIVYPNIKMAFFSSRTRAYVYDWDFPGYLSPEPEAFESGFAVKWLIEKQINGDPELNYDPTKGAVKAPYLAWGAYLWIDGLTPRSDGMIWTQQDVANDNNDCIHPGESGKQKVANMLMNFFKGDTTSAPWFTNSGEPFPTPTPSKTPDPSQSPTPSLTPDPKQTLTPTPLPSPTATPTVWPYNYFVPFIQK